MVNHAPVPPTETNVPCGTGKPVVFFEFYIPYDATRVL